MTDVTYKALTNVAIPSQPTVSRHLAVLRQRSLVLANRDGVAVTYSLADPRIIDLLDTMRQVLRDALARQSNWLA
ncbi:MAG TPA: transcriptional regulator [Anaerolineae bacterium]|nr:transcriptional regulator [Anaerolineae bacterium]